MKTPIIKAPAWLRAETKKWFASVVEDYEMEPHDIKLLTLACESWDRATLARETIAEAGLTYTDRLGNIRKHPAVSIAEAATIAFARLTRELSLSDSAPDDNRPPLISGRNKYGTQDQNQQTPRCCQRT